MRANRNEVDQKTWSIQAQGYEEFKSNVRGYLIIDRRNNMNKTSNRIKRRRKKKRLRLSQIFILNLVLFACLLLSSSSFIDCDHDFNEERKGEQQEQGLVPNNLKVVALASKLEQWLLCRRATAYIASQEPQQQQQQLLLEHSTSIPLKDLKGEERRDRRTTNNIELSTDNPINGKSSTETTPLACGPHFDGHLCWPSAKISTKIRLECPRLLEANDESSSSLNDISRSVKGSSKEENFSSSQDSIIESINSSHLPSTLRSGQELEEQDRKITNNSSSEDKRNATAQMDKKEPKIGIGTKRMRFAYRNCIPAENYRPNYFLMENKSSFASWQQEADYSECKIQESSLYDQSPIGSGSTGRFDPTDEWVDIENWKPDRELFERLVDELDRIELAIDPYSDPDLKEQWILCIGNIMQQQQHREQSNKTNRNNQSSLINMEMQNAAQMSPDGDLYCPIIFDGWRCWPSTKAGETAYVECPRNQPGFSAERKAHKICTQNGTWYRHPMTNRYWSNYTTCVDTVDLAFRTKILNLYVIGNLISLVALSASLIIFISFKSLKCTRVTIHKNLFLSFITNNLMWIIWYTCVVNDANLLQSNPIGCQIWHVLLHYFLVSNYFWMFCEGLYLHTLLVVAFVSEDKILKWFYLLGWLIPIPITLAYAYNRAYDEYYTNFCWMEESPYNLILMAPIGVSLLLNLIFLINIVRVLVTKLRANNSPDTHQTRKAVRATLILIPLLGLHYILTPFRPEAKSEWEVIYESITAVCTSFQGLCVAMLFCFCNGEVSFVIKKKLKNTFNLNQLFPDRNNKTDSTNFRSRSNTVTRVTQYQADNINNELRNHQGMFNEACNPLLVSGLTSKVDLEKLSCLGNSKKHPSNGSNSFQSISADSSLATTPAKNHKSQSIVTTTTTIFMSSIQGSKKGLELITDNNESNNQSKDQARLKGSDHSEESKVLISTQSVLSRPQQTFDQMKALSKEETINLLQGDDCIVPNNISMA